MNKYIALETYLKRNIFIPRQEPQNQFRSVTRPFTVFSCLN